MIFLLEIERAELFGKETTYICDESTEVINNIRLIMPYQQIPQYLRGLADKIDPRNQTNIRCKKQIELL